MDIRKLLKSSEMILGLRNDLWKIQRLLQGRFSTNVLKKYIESHPVKKLQIGAGPIALPGWLGTDLWPTDTVASLDATKPFPIGDCTFDYIHTEHMIEHITWFEGLTMLRECWRILKPGGTIRIATPDLRVITGLYDYSEGSIAEKYIKTTTDQYLQGIPLYRAGFVINSAFYRWGHKFLYDDELLKIALQESGFVNLKRFIPGESDDYNLRGIEMHGRIGNNEQDLNKFETIVYEAKRPPS
jgi:predicted SAM-dependent methyltransferase